jgi:ribosomal protein S18 acetylase RimI-like enzyme
MVVIRRLQKSDKKRLLVLVNKFFEREHWGKSACKEILPLLSFRSNEKSVKDTVSRYMDSDPKLSVVMVAKINGRLEGYIRGVIMYKPDMRFRKIGMVDSWFVSKRYRDKGIGKMLWDELDKWFRENECELLELSVHPSNKHAVEIYRAMGFVDKSLSMTKKF